MDGMAKLHDENCEKVYAVCFKKIHTNYWKYLIKNHDTNFLTFRRELMGLLEEIFTDSQIPLKISARVK